MFSISVKGRFSATHRLKLPDGTWEPSHGHDWRVLACFRSATLDEFGMVLDFHRAQSALQAVLRRLDYQDLNGMSALSSLNPTAEVVARFIFQELAGAGFSSLARVSVMEAPDCTATYRRSFGPGRES